MKSCKLEMDRTMTNLEANLLSHTSYFMQRKFIFVLSCVNLFLEGSLAFTPVTIYPFRSPPINRLIPSIHHQKHRHVFNKYERSISLNEDVNIDLLAENIDMNIFKNTDSVNAALTEMIKSKKTPSHDSVQQAQALLDKIENQMKTSYKNADDNDPSTAPRLNIYSYTIVLDAWAKCGEPQKARDLLKRMIDTTLLSNKKSLNPNLIIPNTVAFNIVINAWARVSGSPKYTDAPSKAQELLQLMEDQNTLATLSNKACLCAPNIVTYNAVMNCIGKSGKGFIAAQQAESILRRISSNTFVTTTTNGENVLPNDVSFGTVLSAYAKSAVTDGIKAAEQAEALLEQMEQMKSNGTALVGPTTFCVNTVINAWSQVAAGASQKREKYQAAIRAEQILLRMEHLFQHKNRSEIRPNTVSYNTVLSAWAKSGARGAPERAEAILRKMDELSKVDDFVAPDNISFNTVLHAWARSNSKWAAKRAESILRHMDKLHEAGTSNIQPDTVTYSTCINAWARAAAYHTFNERDGISPARNAEAILHRMEDVYQTGANPRAKPNLLVYNTVLNAWSKSGEHGAAKRACNILESMEKDNNIQPDVYSFTSVIDACAKAKDAAMAKTILDKMEDLYDSTGDVSVKPNIRSYTSVINAFSRSGGPYSESRGEESNNPEEAEAILYHMEQLHKSGKHDDLLPDTVCYNAVINAYGWSTQFPNKVEKARDIYLQMVKLYQSGENINAKPDIVTCNSILNACAYTKNEEEQAHALEIAISIYESFVDSAPEFGEPNHITYGNMILACTNLVPLKSGEESPDADLAKEKRRKLAETVWWHCCKEGKVSNYVLSKFQDAISFAPEILLDIIGESVPNENDESNASRNFTKRRGGIKVYDLPQEWTCNARSGESNMKRGSNPKSSKFRPR